MHMYEISHIPGIILCQVNTFLQFAEISTYK